MFTGSGAFRSALRSMYSTPAASAGPVSGCRQNSKAAVDFVRHARKTFEEAYNAPSFASATARRVGKSNLISVEYTTLQNDFVRDAKRSVANHMTLSIGAGRATVLAKGKPADMAGVRASLQSPSDPSLVVVLSSANSPNGGRFVEIWRDGVLAKSIDVSHKHGEYYNDAFFDSLAWSTDSKYVIYAAERPEYEKAKPETAASDTMEDIGDITDKIEGAVAGVADPRCYQFEDDWGESYTGKRPPVLVVVDVCNGSVKLLPSIDNVSPGQAQFLSKNGTDAEQIVFTGYQHAIRKHGIVFCYNRPSGIYVCDMDGSNLKCIHVGSVRSARIAPSRKGLVFLSTTAGGPHDSASELVYYDLEKDQAHTLVPIINQPLEKDQTVCGTRLPKGFAGIYTGQLPAQPWLQLGDPAQDILVFTSVWRSTLAVLTLDIQRLALQVHSLDKSTLSNAVLSANGDLVVGTTSTPAHPETLLIGEATRESPDQDVAIQWHHVATSTASDIGWRVIADNGKHERAPECIFVYPQKPNTGTRYFWKNGGAAARPLIEKQVKKEERAELLEKLSTSSWKSGLLRSSRNLGRQNETKREKLQRAALEEKLGVSRSDPSVRLYVSKRAPEEIQSQHTAMAATGSVEGMRQSYSGTQHNDSKGVNKSKGQQNADGCADQKCDIDATEAHSTAAITDTGSDQQAEKDGAAAEGKAHKRQLDEVVAGSSLATTTITKRMRQKKGRVLEKLGLGKTHEIVDSSESEFDSSASESDNSEDSSGDGCEKADYGDRGGSDITETCEQTDATCAVEQAGDISEPAEKQFYTGSMLKPLLEKRGTVEAGTADGTKAYYVPVERSEQIQSQRMQLPVYAEEQQIMEAITQNPVVVLSGETGSGKTTQVPQFLLEAGYGDSGSRNPGMIGITQPRRVAAVSMAHRVAEELGNYGHAVAHQVRFDTTVSDQTRIKFMTEGVLLRELAADLLLTKYSVIIADEAHERSLNTDILLGVLSRVVRLRQKLACESPEKHRELRLVIMSATLRVDDFAANERLFRTPPPVIRVQARQHPVRIHFSRRTPAYGEY
ncbi:putative ATP-dependent RNA helicase DHR1, partial [Coemansia guatemalensis]